jgi:hypothetical protein
MESLFLRDTPTVSSASRPCLKKVEHTIPYDQIANCCISGISLSDNPSDTSNWAPKEKFQLTKNNIIDPEWFETCKYCHRKWHRICGLYDKKVCVLWV